MEVVLIYGNIIDVYLNKYLNVPDAKNGIAAYMDFYNIESISAGVKHNCSFLTSGINYQYNFVDYMSNF